MPSVQALSYDPTLKTVTVAGDIATVNLTSIINQTRGKDLFVVGRTPINNRVFSGGNTTFTLNTNTTGDSAGDVIAVRYQASSIVSIPNPYIVNGVAHFVQDTKPTTRPGSASLVSGDIWYNPVTKTRGFYNGTHWLSDAVYTVSYFDVIPNATTKSFVPNGKRNGLFFESFEYDLIASGTNWDTNNVQRLRITGLSITASIIEVLPLTNLEYTNPANNTLQKKSLPINFANLFGNANTTINRSVNLIFSSVGTINGLMTHSLIYRDIL